MFPAGPGGDRIGLLCAADGRPHGPDCRRPAAEPRFRQPRRSPSRRQRPDLRLLAPPPLRGEDPPRVRASSRLGRLGLRGPAHGGKSPERSLLSADLDRLVPLQPVDPWLVDRGSPGLGGLGLYRLARGQGLDRWPATVAAGTFQASPYLLAQAFEGHHPHVWAACWFPWAFWAFAEFRTGRVRGLLALPPILALTYLTGHPQEWLLLVTALSLWASAYMIISLFQDRQQRKRGAALLLGWAGILMVCLGMAAVEIVPATRLLPWVQIGPQADGVPTLSRNHQLHLVNCAPALLSEGAGRARRLLRARQLLGTRPLVRPRHAAPDRGRDGALGAGRRSGAGCCWSSWPPGTRQADTSASSTCSPRSCPE